MQVLKYRRSDLLLVKRDLPDLRAPIRSRRDESLLVQPLDPSDSGCMGVLK